MKREAHRRPWGLSYLAYAPEPLPEAPPLILFLHGRGERGRDLSRAARYGLPQELERGLELPAVVIAPQCPPETRWTDHGPELLRLLDEVVARYHADLARIYLSGLSMGGQGAWFLASEAPERFAALTVVCARSLPERAPRLASLPIWVFHGDDDEVVPVAESLAMVEALSACGGAPRLTRYPKVRHNAWNQAYANPELYAWLLEQRRAAASSEGK